MLVTCQGRWRASGSSAHADELVTPGTGGRHRPKTWTTPIQPSTSARSPPSAAAKALTGIDRV